MAKRDRTFVGLYCGPSVDGVDAAVVAVRGEGDGMAAAQKQFVQRPLDEDLRKRVRSAASGWSMPAGDLARLDREVGSALAAACEALLREAALPGRYVQAVGVIGPEAACVRPTMSAGPGSVLELGSAATVARETGRPVVAGFGASDLAAGGVGGPVTAWPDWLMFRDDRLSRAVVQLGAIATMTFVGSAAAACEVIAYDVGPGTVLIDALVRQLYEQEFDEDGALAARGKVHEPLLNELTGGEYFQREPPKRTHVREWSGPAIQRVEMMAGKHRCGAADLITTLTELTARTVAGHVLKMTERPHEVVLVGGGAKNIHLAGRIRKLLSPCSTYPADHYGLDMRAHGAICAAVLAAARLGGVRAHCPAATGAADAATLGAVWVP